MCHFPVLSVYLITPSSHQVFISVISPLTREQIKYSAFLIFKQDKHPYIIIKCQHIFLIWYISLRWSIYISSSTAAHYIKIQSSTSKSKTPPTLPDI